MIKTLLSITLITTAIFAQAQSFTATYSFAATTASTGATDPSTPPSASGLTFGSFSAVGTSTSNGSAGRFSFNSWPIATLSGSTSATSYSAMGGSLSLNSYYEVMLSPTSGFSVTVDSVTFLSRRTSTGPRSFALRSSVDSYTANLPAFIVPTNTILTIAGTNEFFYTSDPATTSTYNSGNTIRTNAAGFIGFTSPITFRFYAWNSEQSGGNFGIDDVTFYGSASVVTSIATINFDLNANFNLYPVPNNDGIVYIENKNVQELSTIEVIDVFGSIVLSSKNETSSKIKLNLSEVSNGNYTVRIITANGSTTKKLIIVK